MFFLVGTEHIGTYAATLIKNWDEIKTVYCSSGMVVSCVSVLGHASLYEQRSHGHQPV